MRPRSYILDGHTPVPEADPVRWDEWFAANDNTVANDNVGDAKVWTFFLGIDQTSKGPPLLFETAVFLGPLDQPCQSACMRRYGTWEEAEAGHAEELAALKRTRGMFE